MRNHKSFLMLLLCLPTVLYAQELPPEVLRNAAHCLVVEKHDWLGLSKSKEGVVTFGYIVDTKSYPGEKHVFVVAYAEKSKGKVFDLKLQGGDSEQRFTVENNASFVSSTKGVKFIDPPLGGVWTTELLQSAVKRISLRSKFTISVGELRNSSVPIECRSYAEKP